MKDEMGAVKLINIVAIVLLLVMIIFEVVIAAKYTGQRENTINKDDEKIIENSGEWKKISLGKWYCETEIIELDLNGDNMKEEIGINNTGKYISINDKEYVINKYIKENNKTGSENYDVNQILFVDLNNDGISEIIHRTFSNMLSPAANKYTIYNFQDNNLIEIGNISIKGSIPNEIYVKGNTIKFEYWPYESPQDYTEEFVYELNV